MKHIYNETYLLYRQEYEMRGMEVSNRTRAELMERGERKRKEIEDDFA